MRNILLILCLICASLSSTQAQTKKFNQPVADSLAKWAELDQTAAGVKGAWQTQHYKDSVFNLNEQRLKGVLQRYGFPGYDLVGEKGSNNFWLMVQHCDKHVPFQQKVLKAMKAELPKHNADPKNYAYLTDRVLINSGKKQLYGTQLQYRFDSCQAVPRPLQDSLAVNNRRKDIGLEPIESYLNWMSRLHFDMNKEVYEKKGIYKPKLLIENKF